MPQKLSRNQLYFQCLKTYEKALATLLAPFKTGNAVGQPHMPMLEKKALASIPKQHREFFTKERQERKNRFPCHR